MIHNAHNAHSPKDSRHLKTVTRVRSDRLRPLRPLGGRWQLCELPTCNTAKRELKKRHFVYPSGESVYKYARVQHDSPQRHLFQKHFFRQTLCTVEKHNCTHAAGDLSSSPAFNQLCLQKFYEHLTHAYKKCLCFSKNSRKHLFRASPSVTGPHTPSLAITTKQSCKRVEGGLTLDLSPLEQ